MLCKRHLYLPFDYKSSSFIVHFVLKHTKLGDIFVIVAVFDSLRAGWLVWVPRTGEGRKSCSPSKQVSRLAGYGYEIEVFSLRNPFSRERNLIIVFDEVECTPNFGLWFCRVGCPVQGYILENPHSVRTPKWLPRLIFAVTYHGL